MKLFNLEIKLSIIKILFILLLANVCFNILFINEKKYQVKSYAGKDIWGLSKWEYQIYSKEQYDIIIKKDRYPDLLISDTKTINLFNLPDSTIYFIYGLYLILPIVFITSLKRTSAKI